MSVVLVVVESDVVVVPDVVGLDVVDAPPAPPPPPPPEGSQPITSATANQRADPAKKRAGPCGMALSLPERARHSVECG